MSPKQCSLRLIHPTLFALFQCPGRADLKFHSAGLLWAANLEDRADRSHLLWNLDVRSIGMICGMRALSTTAHCNRTPEATNLHSLPLTEHGAPAVVEKANLDLRAHGVKSRAEWVRHGWESQAGTTGLSTVVPDVQPITPI